MNITVTVMMKWTIRHQCTDSARLCVLWATAGHRIVASG